MFTEQHLKDEFMLSDPEEMYFHTVDWLFDIADSLHWNGYQVPDEWEYRPGLSDPYDPENDEGGERRGMLDNTPEDIRVAFGNKLIRLRVRLRDILVACGRDH